jgi:hypothetical protein
LNSIGEKLHTKEASIGSNDPERITKNKSFELMNTERRNSGPKGSPRIVNLNLEVQR